MNKWLYLNMLHLANDGFKIGLITLLPFLAHELHLNFTLVGLLGASSNIVQIFIAFPAALLATKIGGLKTLTIALFFYLLGYAITSFSPHFIPLLISFLIAGIGFAIFHPIAFALISRWADPSKRGRIIGNFTAIGDIGTAAIPAFVPYLVTTYGWRFTTLLYSVIIFLLGVLAIIFRPTDEKTIEKKGKQPQFRHLLKQKAFITAHIAVIIDTFASSPLIIFLPFLLLKHGFSGVTLGIAIAVYFLGSLIGKSLLGTLTDSMSGYKIFIFGEICMAIAILLLIFTYSFAGVLIIVGCLGALTKGTGPVGLTMVSDAIESHGAFEKAFGFNSVVSAIALSLAPILLGHISDIQGISAAFLAMAFFALLATVPALVFGKSLE
ncbi:MAG TPA: MFS transporter [Patescibacteria group bacterium]|nr:MFS transporter [Patescibacteria group bacterium]